MEAYVNSYVDLRLLLYCGRTSHTACPAVATEATIFNPEEMVSFLHGFEQGEEEGGGGGGDGLWSGPAWLIYPSVTDKNKSEQREGREE